MTLSAYIFIVSIGLVILLMVGTIKLTFDLRKSPLSIDKGVIVSDREEYLSVWEFAHQWEGMDLLQTDQSKPPSEIKQKINRILQAYFREELPLRKPNGSRLLGHHWLHGVLMVDNQHEKLSADLRQDKIDMRLMDCLYLRRGETLHWFAKEFIEPPSCWAPQSGKREPEKPVIEDESKDDWYRKLTPQRKEKVACLEVAKHLWEQEPSLLYEEVRTHPIMTQAGLRHVFTPDSFKTWARDVAPEEAKKGGRRIQSKA